MTQLVSIERAKEIINNNPEALAIAKLWASRNRDRKSMNIVQAVRILKEEGFPSDKHKIAKFLKDLQAAGFGRIVYGRNGNENRFYSDSLIEIGKLLLGQETDFAPRELMAEVAVKPQPVAASMIVVKGTNFSVELPADLDDKQLLRILNTVKEAS